MSPEVIAFPNPERRIDTPETIRECLDLAELISIQVGTWGGESRHPGRHSPTATMIAEDWTTPYTQHDVPSSNGPFDSDAREDALEFNADQDDKKTLRAWVDTIDPDTTWSTHPLFEEHLARLRSKLESAPDPKSLHIAIDALQRLFILAERLVAKTGIPHVLDADYFLFLTAKIEQELQK